MQDPGAEWLSYAALKFLTQLSELTNVYYFLGFPRWCSGKESRCQCRRHKRRGFDPWVRKIPWRRKWQPTPVFLPGKSHGQRGLVGYSAWGGEESDMAEQLNNNKSMVHLPPFLERQLPGDRDMHRLCSLMYPNAYATEGVCERCPKDFLATELWELCTPTCTFHQLSAVVLCIIDVLPISQWGVEDVDGFTVLSLHVVPSVAQDGRSPRWGPR